MKKYNFAAGPAMLPPEVLKKIHDELFNWHQTGVSIMEIGHRTADFQELLLNLENKLRQAINIPQNYKILFVHGGAQGQFSAIPMNLVKHNQNVDYVITGTWSQKAMDIAKQYAIVNVVNQYDEYEIQDQKFWQLNPNARYIFFCHNETINGLRFAKIPNVENVPLVADMTSSILSEVIDVNKFGIIFASAQKNLGIAGVTLVIVREDLLDSSLSITPNIWNYKNLSSSNSLINTAPVFPIYVMDLMLDWVFKNGGVNVLEAINKQKADTLYSYIDNSDFYYNNTKKDYRSIANVPFELKNKNLLSHFLEEAQKVGLMYLKGHAIKGGLRASIYNAMPQDGVDKLIEFMDKFSKKY